MTWWTDLYDDSLADVLLEPAEPAAIVATVEFLVDKLAISRGDRVFDQCAGIGRLALPLAAWGAEVVGVEQAPGYVERATSRATAANLPATFHAADAFTFVAPRPCRAAFNWWTSFGYLPDDDGPAGNDRMLRRAFESLAAGGRFALDFLNVPGILANFRPHEITHRGTLTLLRESTLDLARGVIHKRWTFLLPSGERVVRPSTVRLYAPDRLAAMFAAAGFTRVEIFGSTAGDTLSLDSPRCIVVGVRP